jgi:hypothetical protein
MRSKFASQDLTTGATLMVNIGERVGDVMEDYKNRIVIPPQPSTQETQHMGAYQDNWQRTFDNKEQQPNTELQKINMQTDWVRCNVCKSRVFVKYLDNHLKVHTLTFEPRTSTAIVKVNESPPYASTTEPYTYKKPDETKPTIKTQERYKFRQLEQACFGSTTTKDGRYSDFTIVFWEKEKPSVQSAVYSGGSSSHISRDWERFTIHIVYDSLEDYYTLTSKLSKRAQFSSWDSEDTNPDRICSQEELQSEIRRALLFQRVSPKAAYKHFRKLCKQPLQIVYDEDDRAIITQSENSEVLQERLKKTHTWSSEHHGYVPSNHYDCD